MRQGIGRGWVSARIGGMLLLASAALLPGTAQAQDSTPSTGVFKTGQEVYDICTSNATMNLDACDWFVMASHDMMKFYGDTNMGGNKICLPSGSTTLDVRNAVIAYLRDNPNSRRFSAVSTIYNALTAKYPC